MGWGGHLDPSIGCKIFVKNFEGLYLHAYDDSTGVITIGWGHTGDVSSGDKISKKQAEKFLDKDLKEAASYVNDLTNVPLVQHQFDALVSLVFNIGGFAFQKSTLLTLLNRGDYNGAGKQFLRWDKDSDNNVIPGLTTRREAEKRLYRKGDYSAKDKVGRIPVEMTDPFYPNDGELVQPPQDPPRLTPNAVLPQDPGYTGGSEPPYGDTPPFGV